MTREKLLDILKCPPFDGDIMNVGYLDTWVSRSNWAEISQKGGINALRFRTIGRDNSDRGPGYVFVLEILTPHGRVKCGGGHFWTGYEESLHGIPGDFLPKNREEVVIPIRGYKFKKVFGLLENFIGTAAEADIIRGRVCGGMSPGLYATAYTYNPAPGASTPEIASGFIPEDKMNFRKIGFPDARVLILK